jgi:hypothetical protein
MTKWLELPGADAFVRALEEIKSGISKDKRAVEAYLARLEPPKRTGDPPRAKEMTKFGLALASGEHISAASWLMIAMEAANQGYYLPSSIDTMARIAEDAAIGTTNSRRTCAWHGRHVAMTCAVIYFELTRKLPPIRNYRMHGCCNHYAGLAQSAFERAGLPGWQWAAEDAARDLKSAVGEYKQDP